METSAYASLVPVPLQTTTISLSLSLSLLHTHPTSDIFCIRPVQSKGRPRSAHGKKTSAAEEAGGFARPGCAGNCSMPQRHHDGSENVVDQSFLQNCRSFYVELPRVRLLHWGL